MNRAGVQEAPREKVRSDMRCEVNGFCFKWVRMGRSMLECGGWCSNVTPGAWVGASFMVEGLQVVLAGERGGSWVRVHFFVKEHVSEKYYNVKE